MIVTWKNLILVLLCLLVITPSSLAYEDKVVIISLTGDVEVLASGESTWIKAGIGMVLRARDRIRTQVSSTCDLSFDSKDKNVVGILENSDVVILLRGAEKIELIDANIYAKLSSLKGTSFEIRTPTAVCGARGTGLGVKGNSNGTEATAYKNDIYVRNAKGEEKGVGEGFLRKIDKMGKISKQIEAIVDNIQKFQSWQKNMDKIVRSSKRAGTRKVDRLSDKVEKLVGRTEEYSEKRDEKKINAREETSVSSRGESSGGGRYQD